MNDFYQEVSQKVAECQNQVNNMQGELENRPNIDDINEMLNNKANKPTVAQALHRKANKSEVEEMLKQKVDMQDFHRVMSKLNDKVNLSDFHQVQNQVEAKADRQEIQEISLARGTPTSENFEKNIFNALAKDREIYNNRLENVEVQIDNLAENLNKKAEYVDLDGLNSAISHKMDYENISEMISDLKDEVYTKMRKHRDDLSQQKKDLSEEFYERYNKLSQKLDKCGKDIRSFRDTSKELNGEARKIRSDVKEIVIKEAGNITSQVREEINQALDDWQRDRLKLENEISQKVRKADLIEFKNDLNNRLEPKVELSEVQNALNSLQTEIANRLVNTKMELQNNLSSAQEHLNHMLSKKCSLDEMRELLNSKVDNHQLRSILDSKASRSDCDSIKDSIDRVIRELDTKASLKELQNHIDFTKSSIEDMTKEIIQKAKSRDLVTLGEEKANREEVEKMLQNMQREVNEKVSSKEIKNTLDEQALINEALCSENCIGRWVWKSGELKASCLIPWEVQCVNTCPDNFVWEKNKSCIICVAPGLYEIGIGFYSKKNPNVQVQINGEAVFTLYKESDTVEKHNSTKVKDIGTHPSGNVMGLTHQDYISLPARARVSFIFDGTHKAEGFVSLKKL